MKAHHYTNLRFRCKTHLNYNDHVVINRQNKISGINAFHSRVCTILSEKYMIGKDHELYLISTLESHGQKRMAHTNHVAYKIKNCSHYTTLQRKLLEYHCAYI